MTERVISFEDIKKANETIVTTNIKGKDYAEVNQRIKAFRMVYPDGDINTNIVSLTNGVCVIKAEVYGNGMHLGSGTAYEKEDSTFINKTSFIENCETSAVGRALGMAGFGIDTSVASAEEVQNAIMNQDKPPKLTDTEAKGLYNLLKTKGFDDDQITETLIKGYGVQTVNELNGKQYAEIIRRLKKE